MGLFLSAARKDVALNVLTREHPVPLHVMLTVSEEESVSQDAGPRSSSEHDFIYIRTFYICDWSRRGSATVWRSLATLTGAFTGEGRERFSYTARRNRPVKTEAEISEAAGAERAEDWLPKLEEARTDSFLKPLEEARPHWHLHCGLWASRTLEQ